MNTDEAMDAYIVRNQVMRLKEYLIKVERKNDLQDKQLRSLQSQILLLNEKLEGLDK